MSTTTSKHHERHAGGFSKEKCLPWQCCHFPIWRAKHIKTNCSILVFSSDVGSCFLVKCAIGDQNVHGNPTCTQHGSPTTINAHTIFLHSGNNKSYDMPPPMAGSMSTAGPTANPNEFATSVKRAQPAKISKRNNGKVAKAMLNELNKASHFALSHQSGGGSTFKRSEPYLAAIFGMSTNASLRKCGRLHIPWPLPRSHWRRALLGGQGLGVSMLGKAHCEWSPSSASVGRAHSNSSSCTANG